MPNLFTMRPEGTITQDTDGFTLRATRAGKFMFAYVYKTRELAEAAARKYRVIVKPAATGAQPKGHLHDVPTDKLKAMEHDAGVLPAIRKMASKELSKR